MTLSWWRHQALKQKINRFMLNYNACHSHIFTLDRTEIWSHLQSHQGGYIFQIWQDRTNTVLYIPKMEAEIRHKLFFQWETKIRHGATAAQTDPLLSCIVNRQHRTKTTTTAANLSVSGEQGSEKSGKTNNVLKKYYITNKKKFNCQANTFCCILSVKYFFFIFCDCQCFLDNVLFWLIFSQHVLLLWNMW